MNAVCLSGRLTKDPDIRYTSKDNMAVATFTLAITRNVPKDSDGRRPADFPRITVFGKAAEVVEKYVHKGSWLEVHGRIQTGSYEDRNGNKVYTTDVIASEVTFGPKEQSSEKQSAQREPAQMDFQEIDEDVPF